MVWNPRELARGLSYPSSSYWGSTVMFICHLAMLWAGIWLGAEETTKVWQTRILPFDSFSIIIVKQSIKLSS